MKSSKLILFLVIFMSLPSLAEEQNRPQPPRGGKGGPHHQEMEALISACKADWDSACGVPDKSDREAFHACIETNKANFSEACQEKMSAMPKPPKRPERSNDESEEIVGVQSSTSAN